jgi:hypothetical protein
MSTLQKKIVYSMVAWLNVLDIISSNRVTEQCSLAS